MLLLRRCAPVLRRPLLWLPLRPLSVVSVPLESLGDSITTAVLVKWSKRAGDALREDDVVAVVETDKVTMDIRAKAAGSFVKGLVEEGAEVAVGAQLYEMDSAATATAAEPQPSSPAPLPSPAPESAPVPAPASASASPASASASVSAPLEVLVPVMGESITSGVLAAWTRREGERVNADEVVATIETDKVTVEVRAPQAGVLLKLHVAEGGEVTVGEPLYVLSPNLGPAEEAGEKEPVSVYTQATESKRAASEAKVQAAAKTAPAKPPAPSPASGPSAAAAPGRVETRVKMTRMRLRISQRLKEAQSTAAMLTTFNEVDMTNLMALRNTHKDAFEKTHGVKLGFMSAFVKASTAALLELPAVNAMIDEASGEIVYREYVDVSVAVSAPTGLVVPVLRNTESMSFADIEKSIGAFGRKAKDGSLALEEMTGGTFTISNGGVFGSLMGTPILNPPQSAILGMHGTKMRAVVVDGLVVARPMMYLALTYDHRLIDGREAVLFLKSVAAKIEDPARLLLDL